jgi:hypothetical protein
VSSSQHSDMFVVFTGDTGHWWSRFIREDMGHCYVIVPSNGKFIVAGKNTGKYELYNVDSINDIIGANDITVGYKQEATSINLFALNTCVGNVKQMLGIKKPFIWTPYQLYKHIKHTR